MNPLTATSERPYHCRALSLASEVTKQTMLAHQNTGDWRRPKWTHPCVLEDGNVDYVISDFTR
jgi:hypothetical protein